MRPPTDKTKRQRKHPAQARIARSSQQTQGKIERWHQALKNHILLDIGATLVTQTIWRNSCVFLGYGSVWLKLRLFLKLSVSAW